MYRHWITNKKNFTLLFSTGKDKSNIQLAAKALQLVASASAQLSQHRRDLIVPELDSQLKPLSAVSNPITDNLFVDDLAKQVKKICETQQLGSNISRPVLRRPDFYRSGGGSQPYRGHARSSYIKAKPFLGRASQRAPPFQRRNQSHKSRAARWASPGSDFSRSTIASSCSLSLYNTLDNFPAGKLAFFLPN